MEPRATTGEPALRVRYDLPFYVSEAAQFRLPGDRPAADAGPLGTASPWRARHRSGFAALGPPDNVGVLALERLVRV
jgi:hypothetical protein